MCLYNNTSHVFFLHSYLETFAFTGWVQPPQQLRTDFSSVSLQVASRFKMHYQQELWSPHLKIPEQTNQTLVHGFFAATVEGDRVCNSWNLDLEWLNIIHGTFSPVGLIFRTPTVKPEYCHVYHVSGIYLTCFQLLFTLKLIILFTSMWFTLTLKINFLYFPFGSAYTIKEIENMNINMAHHIQLWYLSLL